MSDDVVRRLDAIANIAELAYIIGGLRYMNMVNGELFGEDGE